MADLRMLANEGEVVEVISFDTKKKYHIASLKPEDFAGSPEIRNKYFWNKVRSLDRFHIPELSKEEYEAIAKDFKRTAKFDEKCLKFETASDYYIRKARIEAVAKDLGCRAKDLDLTDYIWDERYYLRYSFLENVNYVDEMYRDEGDDKRDASANEVYIAQDPKTANLDEQMWDELFSFCCKAIKARKAMLLSKVDKCLGFLISVLEYTNGFSENATQFQVKTMEGFVKFFENLLSNEEFMEFLKHNNDITVFGDDTMTHSDYVETYRSLCKLLIRGTDEDMAWFESTLTQIEDPYISELLEVKESLEIRGIYDDADGEDDDEDILD